MSEQATAVTQVTSAVDSMRRQTDQASKALVEQARAMKDVSGATQNIAKQIKLIARANHDAFRGQQASPRSAQGRPAAHRAPRTVGDGDSRRHQRVAEARRSAHRRGVRPEPEREQRPRMTGSQRSRSQPDRDPHDRHRAGRQKLGRRAGAHDRYRRGRGDRPAPGRRSCPISRARSLLDALREPLLSGSPVVLAPALHHYFIPCAPLEPSAEFDRMQQRVVIGALKNDEETIGVVVTIEDVTARLERERRLAQAVAGRRSGPPAGSGERSSRPTSTRTTPR